MAISEQSIEKIKSGSISKVIEALGSKLKRVGREYVTQCIWHEDTNPSLTINDDKGFCFCHVCRGGGDVIAYTRKRKGGLRRCRQPVCSILAPGADRRDKP